MGHLPHPNLCGGLLFLPYLVVVGFGCSSSSSDWSSAGLSAGGSFPVLVGVFGPASSGGFVMVLVGLFAVAPFGRPLCFATAFLVSGANFAGWQFAQWYILCRSFPDASFPRSRSRIDLPLCLTIGYGPAMSGPSPFLGILVYTCVALAAESGNRTSNWKGVVGGGAFAAFACMCLTIPFRSISGPFSVDRRSAPGTSSGTP